jgi:hypothetical protein
MGSAPLLRLNYSHTMKMLFPIISHFPQVPNENISNERIPNGLKIIHRQVCPGRKRGHERAMDSTNIDHPLDIDPQPFLAFSRLGGCHDTPHFPLH